MNNNPFFAVLFLAFSGALREPDTELHREQRALEDAQLPYYVVNAAALTQGDFDSALWAVKPSA